MWEPFGNTTVLPPTKWHPEPQFRGSFSILSSCLITMSLCTWTSLHLNIPEHRKEHLQKYRKAGWMVLGLLAPELVVWNAWDQKKKVKRLSALMRSRGFMPKKPKTRGRMYRWLNRAWQKIRVPLSSRVEEGQDFELVNIRRPDVHSRFITMGRVAARILFPPRTENTHCDADHIPYWQQPLHSTHLSAWTDVHSWFVVMGGVVFEDKSPEDQQFMPEKRQRLPVNLELFEWMAKTRPHLIPDLPREFIEDKSKSDWFAKGLTCWQAGYFCIQCTFRFSQQLSITLLETNVFAHAICALLLFFCWWDKPRDILVPIGISSEDGLDICAGHLSSERLVTDARGLKHRTELMPVLDQRLSDECFGIVHPTTIIVHEHSESPTFMAFADGTHYKFLEVRGTYWRLVKVVRALNVPDSLDAERCYSSGIAVALTSREISRLSRAYRYSTRIWARNKRDPGSTTMVAPRLRCRISDWSLGKNHLGIMFGIKELSDHVRTIAGITFASSCYGGLHLIAWTSAFPSHAALVLWRAASVTTLATGLFCVAIAALAPGHDWLSRHALSRRLGLGNILVWFSFCLSGLFIIWYILCRTFIVVECFILLGHIPESALRVPTWATYIPSFG